MEEHGLSRRELLKRLGLAGVAVSFPMEAIAPAAPEALETLTASESDILEAIVARLIPTDANGPGAAEAHAATYIDRALAGALSSSRPAYTVGLAAIDEHAQSTKGAPFAKLSPQDQDAILSDIEKNAETAGFFSLVRAHTIQGAFSDPYYGGNANFVGWDLLGYPGVRLSVGADLQRLDSHPEPTHKSAYEYSMFSKKRPEGGADHGDHAKED